eukprot:scaffold608454_cov32-Prasinocladus_malaysianus.AAC.1
MPGLRLPLSDTEAVSDAVAMGRLASQADLQVALRWFERLAEGGTAWARFALAGLYGVGIPGVLSPNLEVAARRA